MKKIGILLLILLTACQNNKELSNNKKEEVVNNEKNLEIKETYTDENQVKLGLFLYDNNYKNKERLEDTYFTDFTPGKDIGSFEVFLTDDKAINGKNFKSTWNDYYNRYDNIKNHKIGFNIKFMLKNGRHYNKNYFEPDNFKFSEYFYTYLYDDINQIDGAYYSHLEEVNENTLLTSIKIYAVDNIDEVDSFILSAFTYDSEDDFDEEGNYRGNSIYVIRIKRK